MASEIQIRILNSLDQHVLNNVAPEVFDGPIHESWTTEFLDDPRHHIVVALDGELVVGMASGVHYVHPDKGPDFFINEVGVDDSYTRRGIGAKMMQALTRHARSLGCESAWVITELDNHVAREFYKSMGAAEEQISYCTFDLKSTES